jgi:hypothetical protein
MQKITPQGAETISAELNDFLAGRQWEYWDAATKQIVHVLSGATEFNVKVAYIGNRYLVISYSVTSSDLYQYALVFDTVLKRWGKLKFDHVDCFSYSYPNVFGDLAYEDLTTVSYEDFGAATYADLSEGLTSSPPSKKVLAFLKPTGAVHLALMTYNKEEATQLGVAIFGKFQLLRNRMITLQYIDFEGIYRDEVTLIPDIVATVLTALDGKNLTPAYPLVLTKNSVRMQRYAKRVTGVNISLALEGSFALSSYIMEVTAEGDR